MKSCTLDRRFVARILIIMCMLAGFVPCVVVPVASIVWFVRIVMIGIKLRDASYVSSFFCMTPCLLTVVQIILHLILLGLSVILLMTAIGGLRFRWWAWTNIVVFGLLVLVLTGLELFAFTVSRIPVAVIVFYIVLFTAALYFFISPKTVRLFSPTEERDSPTSSPHRLRPINIVTLACLASFILVPVTLLVFVKISLIMQNRDNLIDQSGTRFQNIDSCKHLFDADCVERTIRGLRLKLPRGYVVFQADPVLYTEDDIDIVLTPRDMNEKRFPLICKIGSDFNQLLERSNKGTLRGERSLYESSWNLSTLLDRWRKFYDESVFEYSHNGMSGFIKILTYKGSTSYAISVYRGREHYVYDVEFVVYDPGFDERFISFVIANMGPAAGEGRDSFEAGMSLFGHGNYLDAQFAFLEAYGARHDTESLYMLVRSMVYFSRTQPLFHSMLFEIMLERIFRECPEHEGARELWHMIKVEDEKREKRRIEERAREKAATWHPFH